MTTEPLKATAAELPLTELFASPLNPRKHFDPRGMAELTESVREHGVLTPLLVRPAKHGPGAIKYEILAGERRYRAAKAAELAAVPCIVRRLEDSEALELMLIENLQRADVHPIEEARGFQQMMNLGRYTPTQLAAKMGKDESYVRRRVHLLKLFEGFQVLFEKGDIQLAHAQELCRLTEGEQRRAMKAFRGGRGWDHWDTPGDLRQWIENHVHMQLKKAAFPKNDAELVPAAGSCLDCPKRTGSSPMLFPDIKSPDICTDPACFNGKLDAFVKAETIRLREKGEPFILMTSVDSYEHRTPPKGSGAVSSTEINSREEEKACKHQELALIVTGPDRGHKQRICRDKKCSVHTWSSNESHQTSSKKARTIEKKRKLEMKRRGAILVAIAAKIGVGTSIPHPSDEQRTDLLVWCAGHLSSDHARMICQAMSWETKQSSYGGRDFSGTLQREMRKVNGAHWVAWLEILRAGELDCWWWAGGNSNPKMRALDALAKRAHVDVSKITADSAGKREKAPKAKAARA
jgi:ParB family chromosome partitioning protein